MMPMPKSDRPLGTGRAEVREAAARLAASGAYPSIVALAAAAGVATSTVEYHRKALIARGEWPVEPLRRGQRDDGRCRVGALVLSIDPGSSVEIHRGERLARLSVERGHGARRLVVAREGSLCVAGRDAVVPGDEIPIRAFGEEMIVTYCGLVKGHPRFRFVGPMSFRVVSDRAGSLKA
jgi:hypothetical protein